MGSKPTLLGPWKSLWEYARQIGSKSEPNFSLLMCEHKRRVSLEMTYNFWKTIEMQQTEETFMESTLWENVFFIRQGSSRNHSNFS